jgi:hypothetical protein
MHEKLTIDSSIDAGMLLVVKNDEGTAARLEFIIGVDRDQKVFHELIIQLYDSDNTNLGWWLESFNYHPADPCHEDGDVFNLL